MPTYVLEEIGYECVEYLDSGGCKYYQLEPRVLWRRHAFSESSAVKKSIRTIKRRLVQLLFDIDPIFRLYEETGTGKVEVSLPEVDITSYSPGLFGASFYIRY